MNTATETINKPLLLAVAKHITEEPRRLDMARWADDTRQLEMKRIETPQCKTVGCIAGWTTIIAAQQTGLIKRIYGIDDSDINKRIGVALHKLGKLVDGYDRPEDYYSTKGAATKLLGITGDQAATLFYTESWPEPFQTKYMNADYKLRLARQLTMDVNGFELKRVPKELRAKQERASLRALKARANATAARIRHFVKTGE